LKIWFLVVGLALAALHQDFWLWDDGRLIFDFLPIGLGYHAGYSIIVTLFWAAVVTWAWPSSTGQLNKTATNQDAS